MEWLVLLTGETVVATDVFVASHEYSLHLLSSDFTCIWRAG
jgi:hypothetical protein